MNDLKALIVQNELALPKEQVDRLLSLNGRKGLYALAPEKEPGPFLLYCCGDDLDSISAKMNMPRDVIVATAIQYRWPDKARVLHRDKPGIVPADLQKELVNTILVATVVAMQKELGEVIAGRKDAKDCPLIPSSPSALEKLMAMVSALNAPGAPQGPQVEPKPGTTIVHAQQVQINQGLPPKEEPERAVKRLTMLKEIEDSAG